MRSALFALAFFEMIFASSSTESSDSSDVTQDIVTLQRLGRNEYLAIDEKGCYIKNCTGQVGCNPRLEYSGLSENAPGVTNVILTQVGTNFSETAQVSKAMHFHKLKVVKLKCTKGSNHTTHFHNYDAREAPYAFLP